MKYSQVNLILIIVHLIIIQLQLIQLFIFKKTTSSSIDISYCYFINNVKNKSIIYSNCNNLIIHDISFEFDNTSCNARPLFLGHYSKTEIYNTDFIKCTMYDEEGSTIIAN